MRAPSPITGWPVQVVHGLTGALEGPVGPRGPTGGLLTGALGPTGPIGRLHTGPAGPLMTGPIGVAGLAGADTAGPAGEGPEGPTGPYNSGLAWNIWQGGIANPTGPFNSRFVSALGLNIKVSPTVTGQFYLWFAGTFANNQNLSGMDIELRRAGWPGPNWGQNLFGVYCGFKTFRNLQTNMRTEFMFEIPDNFGNNGRPPSDLLGRDWAFDLGIATYPDGSLLRLYDIEWVILEI